MLANHNAIEDSGYVIDRSLRFMEASSQYLTRTPSVASDRQKFTVSTWVKIGQFGVPSNPIISAVVSGSNVSELNFDSSNRLDFFSQNTTGTVIGRKTTTRVFRDPSAWYHIVLAVDTTNTTATDRIKLYVNGTEETSFAVRTNFSLNDNTGINFNTTHRIGGRASGSFFFDGYQTEFHLIDGQALTPSSFGEINPKTGQWVAKRYTGTYGTNGFYLDFKDGTSTTTLGNDKSGIGNNWTLTNFTRSAGENDCWMLDVPAGNGSASAVQPSGNYAVLNTLKLLGAYPVFARANLKASMPADTTARGACSSIKMPSGKFYFEVFVEQLTYGTDIGIGVAPNANIDANSVIFAVGWYRANGAITNLSTTAQTSGATYTSNDLIGVAVDISGGTVQFYKNNIAQGSTPSFTFTPNTELTPYLFFDNNSGPASAKAVQFNFGQRSFAYTPPTGFKALCTANLPTPSIKKPSDHFNVQLSTGANIKTNSEALFTNELEWIKDRANANNHQLIDSVRGSNAVLQSNTTAAETTYTAPSGSSVGWVWRASDSVAVSNTSGSISSQVSANPTAGFSAVIYTGTGANATVGHGLGISPSMVIVKRRDATANWQVRHSSIVVANSIQLNLTNAQASATTVWNSTSPTSSVFSLGTSTDVNASGGTYVAYCFSEIAGYSKFGSYTGNGSADGPFVYLGFKPAYVMIKRTDSTSNWTVFDNERSGYNRDNDQLYANASGSEVTTDLLDLNSNGFKLRSTDISSNASGGTYLYMAFAETPFQYSNAR